MQFVRKSSLLAGRLIKLGLTNPARLSHVFGSALAASEEVKGRDVDLLRIPAVPLEDLLPNDGTTEFRITVALFPKAHAAVSPLEAIALAVLLRRANALRIFEFGTYKGVSITQLALNLPPESEVYTLDLPEEDPRSAFAITDPEDIEIALEKGKGRLVPPDLKGRIQFLKQDSATFDPKPFVGRMDFVFVDGAHNAEYVRNDSEKGWQMLRPGGVLVWHDCRKEDPAVVRYLLASDYGPRRIFGTTLAFATKDAK